MCTFKLPNKMNDSNKRVSTLKPYVSKAKRKKLEAEKVLQGNSSENELLHDENVEKLLESFSGSRNSHCMMQKPKKVVVNLNATKLRETKHTNAITKLRWCNQFGHNIFVSASMDSSFILWNCSSNLLNPLIVQHRLSDPIKDIRWSPWDPQISCVGFDKCATVYDVISGKVLNRYEHSDFLSSLLYHPTQPSILISGTFKNGIYAWDQRSKKIVRQCQSIHGQIHDMIFLPDHKTLVSSSEVIRKGSTDRTIVAWDFETMARISNQIYQDVYSCFDFCLNQSQNTFLTQTSGSYIARFSATSPFKLDKSKRYENHKSTSYRIGFDIANDDRLIATGSDDGHLHLYDYQSSKEISHQLIFDNNACTNIAFDHQGSRHLAIGGWNGEIVVKETKPYYD